MDHVRVDLYGADFKNEQRTEKKGESEDELGKNKNVTFERRSESSIDYERFSYFVEESSATNRITHTSLKQRQTGEEQREKIVLRRIRGTRESPMERTAATTRDGGVKRTTYECQDRKRQRCQVGGS